MAINKFDNVVISPYRTIVIKRVACVSFLLFIFVESLVPRDSYWGGVNYNIILADGCVVSFLVVKKIPNGKISKRLIQLGGMSFFVFCIHEMFVKPVQDFFQISIGMNSLSYILVFIFVTMLSYISGVLLRYIVPKVYNVLIGFR